METIIILVVILLVVIAVAAWLVQRQRTARLRRRFGDEYDRTLDRSGNRREAEQTLAQVVQRREELTLRPLTAQQRQSWVEQWGAVQSRFVDSPDEAVTTARDLLPALMRDRGYPTEDFEERATLLAADHPVVVGEYRAAEQAYQRHVAGGGSSTEALRQSLVHYRALFEALVEEHQDRSDADREADREADRDAGLTPDATRAARPEAAPLAGGAVRDHDVHDVDDVDDVDRTSLHGRHAAGDAPTDPSLDTNHRGVNR
jgi:hypothetical protein